MTRNTRKNPVELIGATYNDIVDEFCKKFDIPSTMAGAIPVATHREDHSEQTIAQMAIVIAFDSGLAFAKAHPEKVVLHLPPSP